MKDASLEVSSPIRNRLESIAQKSVQDSVDARERVLFSLLPVNSENRTLTIENMLGVYELSECESVAKITERFETIQTRALNSGCDLWVLEAASLAGIEYTLASNLRAFIESSGHLPDFAPPDDNYVGWAIFLLGWLKTLPAPDTWEFLQAHLKAWRYSWGRKKDSDIAESLTKNGYPNAVKREFLEILEPIWKNLQDTICAWLSDKSLLEIGEILTRKSCASDKRMNRSAGGNYLPRAILWSQRVIEPLAQFAGLLLAIQNQWAEHSSNSMPDWFANTSTLHTFPQGLRYGVQNPAALAWHQYVISERRAANLLQSFIPLEVEEITDLQDAWQHIVPAREEFVQSSETRDSVIVPALRRIVESKP